MAHGVGRARWSRAATFMEQRDYREKREQRRWEGRCGLVEQGGGVTTAPARWRALGDSVAVLGRGREVGRVEEEEERERRRRAEESTAQSRGRWSSVRRSWMVAMAGFIATEGRFIGDFYRPPWQILFHELRRRAEVKAWEEGTAGGTAWR